ncbi:YcaO-like family protein [Pseudomonas moorei]|jgi:hypothetical protein|uniref:YcaO-like family protein n=1 Tax=Pseudomonas moorei TaxID=395599 RepID=UPI0036F2B0E9
MMLNNPGHLATLPSALIYQPSCLLSFPSSVELVDSWLNGGSGIGNGSSSIKAALGEYFERRHFYMEVKSDVVGHLNYSLANIEAEKFAFAFAQTNEGGLVFEQALNHSYNLTRVSRVSDWSDCYIPTACISLNYNKIESENTIYPLRDTCGCSFHWRFEEAVFGSIKEYLERQFLAKFWLTKQCARLVSVDDVRLALRQSGACSVYEALSKSGEVTIIDVSDAAYPGLCLLAVYGQKDKTRHVKYCAGISYAETLKAALEKSLYELWQTYRFIDLFQATGGNVAEIEDSYLRYFLSCNAYETYQEITDVEFNKVVVPDSLPDFSLQNFLTVLNKRQVDGYLYVNYLAISNELYYFCKFISPDFFLHMNNSRGINILNKYSEEFAGKIFPDRRKIMVPFP